MVKYRELNENLLKIEYSNIETSMRETIEKLKSLLEHYVKQKDAESKQKFKESLGSLADNLNIDHPDDEDSKESGKRRTFQSRMSVILSDEELVEKT